MSAHESPPDNAGGRGSDSDLDDAITQLLSTEVAETYDRMQADPNRGAPLDVAFARLRRARGV